MAENKNETENINEGSFPIRDTNGDASMKNISPLCPSSLPFLNMIRP